MNFLRMFSNEGSHLRCDSCLEMLLARRVIDFTAALPVTQLVFQVYTPGLQGSQETFADVISLGSILVVLIFRGSVACWRA